MPPEKEVPRAAVSLSRAWLVGIVIAVFAAGLFFGVTLAHSNSDYVCSANVTDSQQGACTGGSWSNWTTVGGTQQRTYTGIRSTVTFNGKVNNVSCSHPQYTKDQASGTVTTQYAACQIVETGAITGTGNNGAATVTVTGHTETTGAVLSSTTNAINGSYNTYLNAAEAALATSTLYVVPSLVHSGDKTHVIWTSNRMKSCTVTAPNSDTWSELASPEAGEPSSPIQAPTTYTLTCINALGMPVVSRATVNLIPVFQEQ